MKKLIYSIIAIVVLFFGFTVAFQNRHAVDVNYYFGFHWQGPLVWIMLLLFAAGALIGFLASLRIVIRMQRRLVQARKELRRKEQEVTNLRALPIKDVL
ncbi:MAG: LapA family protein [Gammaproteobacteria bacterium]|nr:LapA family protein [Gammaproteobacteria bacterium]